MLSSKAIAGDAVISGGAVDGLCGGSGACINEASNIIHSNVSKANPMHPTKEFYHPNNVHQIQLKCS